MNVPLTVIMSFAGTIVMLIAWYIVGQRMRNAETPVVTTVRYLHIYFLFFAMFFGSISIADLWLVFAPASYPLAAALGYVIGHVFLYVSLIYIAKSACQMVPSLARKERLITYLLLALAAVTTVVSAITTIGQKQPMYDYAHNLTLWNAAPIEGILIAVIALITILPSAVLFAISAFNSNGSRRLRSAFLASGLFLNLVGGPMHDNATTGMVYNIADVITIIGFLLLVTGVVYKFEQNMALSRAAPTPAQAL